ncbi:hypothetical protein WN944_014487 [Citrus x changshan-huyou]|uniref:Uncharacterized protein n=1 Tax=Citrus x changshan-huyou TaxID=2935761 RepID=A0AAP0M5V7_9ROSI
MERFMWHYNQASCTLLFFYFLLFGYNFQVDCSSSFHYSSPKTTHRHFCPPEQSFALLQFKNNTSASPSDYSYCDEEHSSHKTNSWTEGTDCCSCDGLICDNVTGNVIGLDLHGSCSWLRGTIDDNSTLFRLSHLQSLNLAFNNFLGSRISPEFGRLKELTYLNLSFSNFGGLVPSEISHLSKLTHLDLSCRVLTIEQRTFDLLASNLTKLSLLHLGSTNLSLIKPFSLLNLSSTMTDLDLSDLFGNSLQGKVPSWLFTLPSLVSVNLAWNKLTGPIDRFQSPNSLEEIHGTIPSSLFQLVDLTDLDLSSNNLSGTIRIHGRISKHDSKGLKSLIDLDLSNNFLTHIALHPWKNIRTLDLRNNKIQGSILVPPPSTEVFLVSNNTFDNSGSTTFDISLLSLLSI